MTTRSRDIKLQRAQKRLTAGLTTMVSGVDKLLDLKSKVPELKEPVRQLFDGLVLLIASNAETNFRRKEFIRPDLNSRFQDLVKVQTIGAQLLFGDDLSKAVKDLSETNKVGYDI